MLRRSGFRVAVLFLSLLVAAAPAAIAQPRAPLFETLWEALSGLFGISEPQAGHHAMSAAAGTCERGSIMDPDGCPGAQASDPDSGSIMDPDG
jgi:hypothetical protein